jgi:hypothetical protein
MPEWDIRQSTSAPLAGSPAGAKCEAILHADEPVSVAQEAEWAAACVAAAAAECMVAGAANRELTNEYEEWQV